MARLGHTPEEIAAFMAGGDPIGEQPLPTDWLHLPPCGACKRFPFMFTNGWFCRAGQRSVEPKSGQCVRFEPRADDSLVEGRARRHDAHITERNDELERIARRKAVGVVYFVDCGEYTKIGHTSTSLTQRMGGLLNGNPFEIRLWAFVHGSQKIERMFHREMKRYHYRLEWFKLTPRARAKLSERIGSMGGTFLDERYPR